MRKAQQKVGTRKLFYLLQPFLREHNISMGRDALFRLLSEHSLLIKKRKRKVPLTTFSDHWMRKYPNLIRAVVPVAPHKILVSDITYIVLEKGRFAYLSLVTDAYSRKVVGYCLGKSLSAASCIKALKMAISQLPAGARTIHHSDRGSQYCCHEYVSMLQANKMSISMTQSGDPLENAIAERVNGILKQELLEEKYYSFKQASEAMDIAISVYNNQRLHSSIDMLTPACAHLRTGELKRHWKNYYSKKEVIMS